MELNKADGTTKTALGKLEYNSNNYIIGVTTQSEVDGSTTTEDVRNINYVILDDVKYTIQAYNRQNIFFEELISGDLTLYKGGNDYFLIKDEFEVRKVPYKDYNTIDNTLDYGIISVYINKCQSTQDMAYANKDMITPSVLEQLVLSYNDCNKSENIIIPKQAVEDSKVQSDKIAFGISLGYAFMTTDFEKFVSNSSTGINTPSVGAKLYVFTNPNDSGIFFDLAFDYFFPKDQQVSDIIFNETGYYSALVGINYMFRLENKTFSPFIGAKGGLIVNNMSSVTDKQPSHDLNYDANSLLSYNFTVGSFINVFNQNIEAAFIYQPKMKFEVDNSSVSAQNNQSYDVSSLQFKLTYCF
ncbi:hypothetical protein ACW5R3_09980 [Bizionia sp. KMM 8389]